MLTIEIKGRIPSLKNSKMMVCRGNRPILLPSAKYQTWHEDQLWLLKKYKPKEPITKTELIELYFTFPDKRKSDMDNKASSIFDLLKHAEIIEDDNYDVLPHIVLHFSGIDKDLAGVKIHIH